MKWFIKTFKLFLLIELIIILCVVYIFYLKTRQTSVVFAKKVLIGIEISMENAKNTDDMIKLADALKDRTGVDIKLLKQTNYSGFRLKGRKLKLIFKTKGKIAELSYRLKFTDDLMTPFLNSVSLLFIFLTALSFAASFIITQNSTKVYQSLERIVDDIRYGRKPLFPKFKDMSINKLFFGVKEIYKLLENRQKRIEEDKERLSSIISSMNEGLILLNESGSIELVNPEAVELLGCGLKQKSNFFADCSNYIVLNAFQKILKDNLNIYELELNEKYLSIKTQFVKGKRLVLISDMTQHKKYDIMKAQFFADASHELKTPIASILGYSETLISNGDIEDSVRNKFLNYIYINAKDLNELIEDILKLHRLETAKKRKKGSCRIKEICDELNVAFLSGAKKKGLLFILKCEDLTVKIPKEYMKSILWNLADNAIKHTEQGRICVRCYKDDKELVLEVEDTGSGIDEKHRDRIFERFYTTQKGRNKSLSGTGLGLSIVKHIVHLYNGNIEVKSEVGKGSLFRIKLNIL